ncbi:MAG: DUF2231 domain-containing protein [Acidimicrobiales bacterium]
MAETSRPAVDRSTVDGGRSVGEPLPDAAATDAPHVEPPTDPLAEVLALVEQSDSLDPFADRVLTAARDLLGSGPVGEVLTGGWLGHPLHPVLVDLPIGFWTSGVTLDVLMPRRSHDAARKLIGLGVLCAVPAALSGWADASQRETPEERRTAIVHAACNGSATVMFAASWLARRHDHHLRGKVWGLFGSAAATAGAAFGGHLAFGEPRLAD